MMIQSNKIGDRTSWAFKALILFTLVLYISPQSYFPVLEKLHLGKLTAVLAILCYFLDSNFRQKKMNQIEFYIAVLTLIALVSIPFSSWKGGSYNFFFDIFSKVLIMFFLLSRTVSNEKEIKILIFVLVSCCIYFAITGIWNYSHGIYLKGWRIGGPKGGLARDPNDLALTLLTTAPLAIGMYQLSIKPLRRIFYIGSALLMLAGTVVSFSRGGFLGALAVCISYLHRLKFSAKIKTLLFALLILVPIYSFMLPEGYVERISTIVDIDKDQVGSAQTRWEDMKSSVSAALKRPILGYGLAMNTLALQDTRARNYRGGVHSAPLQILSELGFVAFFIYILLFYKTFQILRSLQDKEETRSELNTVVILARNLEPALWGFIVAAFFLPVAYRWYFYYLAGITSALFTLASFKRVVKDQTE